MSHHHDHYIDNQWRQGFGLPLTSRNPYDGTTLWQGNQGNEQDVKTAVKAAKAAFQKWSLTPIDIRVAHLKKFGNIVKENAQDLTEAISKEVGKPLWESLQEVQAMIGKIDISISAYHERCPTVMKEHPLGHLMTRHKPHGVVAIFGPFNFPAHLPNGHIIPALLAGNTIIFKPSEMTPLVAEKMIECWEKADLPKGVLNMIQGGRETGRFLTDQKEIDGIFFTGSYETGKILSDIFLKQPGKILALEMGGNNPIIIHEIKDLKAAIYTIIQSAYLTSGQRCTCARRLILIEGKEGRNVLNLLKESIPKIVVGSYTKSPEPFMGTVISEKAAKHIFTAQDTLKSHGAEILVPSHLLKLDSALISPALIDITAVKIRPDEEIFGPLLQVIFVQNFAQAIFEANNTDYGLVATLLTEKEENYKLFYNQMRAGVINWNTPSTGGSSLAPFGGIGKSGNFRPSGYYAADYCSYPIASIETKDLKTPSPLPPGFTL